MTNAFVDVILSEAKNLALPRLEKRQILRFAQDDTRRFSFGIRAFVI